MNKNSRLVSVALGLALALPTMAQAEESRYHCTYTEASYIAPFMKQPNIRKCPETHCTYSVVINEGQASINGVYGFDVERAENLITLRRTAKDPIMGGLDTTTFTINTSDNSFVNVKTTTPSVELTTRGQCQ